MKKTKKFLVGLLCVLSVCVFAGCEEEHIHSYTDEVTAPTCTEKGYTTHTCSCGDTVVDTYVDELGHDFKEYVSDNNATYDSDGTKTATCERENCEEKDTVTEANTKLESKIAFKSLIVNGLTVYGKVSNETGSFSFIDEIATFGKAKFIVSLDIYGTQQVTTKTIPLMLGDNTVYITEMIDDEPTNVYSVTVRRRPMYEVLFNPNGGSEVQNQMVEEDGFVALSETTTRAGYDFAGWDYDFSQAITGNITINAQWTAHTDTAYKVEYYFQDLQGQYVLDNAKTENKTGKTDTTASVTAEAVTGFTYDEWQSKPSGNINGDGSLALKLYYSRNRYSVRCQEENGYTIGYSEVYYQEEKMITATPDLGYTFLGWYNGETLLTDELSYTFAMPAESVTYTAKWSANTDTAYKVEYYFQDLQGQYVLDNAKTQNKTGKTDTTASVTAETITGFTYDEWQSKPSGNINGDGSLALKLYYSRNSYTLSVNRNDTSAGTVSSGRTYKYGQEVTVTATTNLGYTFLGWYNGETLLKDELNYTFEMPANNVTYTANWSANTDTAYKVEYYLEDLQGQYVLDHTENKTGTTNTTASVMAKTIMGFAYNNNKSKPSGNVNGDGSLTLKLYYTRNSYTVSTSTNNTSAGLVSGGRTYKYGQEVTVTATTNLGYTFLGWYNGETLLKDELNYTFEMPANNVTYTANWTYYILTTTKNISGGSISFYSDKKITAGTSTTITATTNIGYTWLGWYNGETLLTDELSCTFAMPAENVTYTAKWEVAEEMRNFNFTSTAKTCSIGGIKDKTVTEIVIPDYVTRIDSFAFSSCENLTHVCIGSGITNIGMCAFSWCISLTSIIVSAENAFYQSIEDNLYTKDETILIQYAIGKENTSFLVPKNVTTIEKAAFSACVKLINVTIPDNVTTIEKEAFMECVNLQRIEISKNVNFIGYDAFFWCDNLTIYCEVDSQPTGWDDGWNHSNCPVVWGSGNE